MPQFTKSLCWAAVLIALAFANRIGLVADRDANLLFVLIPALWLASARPACPRKGAAA